MGKKFDALKIEFNKLSLKVDLLNEFIAEKFGFDEDTEKFKCKEQIDFFRKPNESFEDYSNRIHRKSKDDIILLPEGVRFIKMSDDLFFMFGNNQAITYDKDCDYFICKHSVPIKDDSIRCHLEPCNTKDLVAGDWFNMNDDICLMLSDSRWLYPSESGEISIWHRPQKFEVKKIIYTP